MIKCGKVGLHHVGRISEEARKAQHFACVTLYCLLIAGRLSGLLLLGSEADSLLGVLGYTDEACRGSLSRILLQRLGGNFLRIYSQGSIKIYFEVTLRNFAQTLSLRLGKSSIEEGPLTFLSQLCLSVLLEGYFLGSLVPSSLVSLCLAVLITHRHEGPCERLIPSCLSEAGHIGLDSLEASLQHSWSPLMFLSRLRAAACLAREKRAEELAGLLFDSQDGEGRVEAGGHCRGGVVVGLRRVREGVGHAHAGLRLVVL